jgi:hypothetical protein
MVHMESSKNYLTISKGARFKFADTRDNSEYETADDMKVPIEHFEGFLAKIMITFGVTDNKRLHTYHTLILGNYNKTSCGSGKETGRYFDGKLSLSPGIRYCSSECLFKDLFTDKIVMIILQPKFTVLIPPGYYGAVVLWNQTSATLLESPKKIISSKPLQISPITPGIKSRCSIISKGTIFKLWACGHEYRTAIDIETPLKFFDGFLVEIMILLNITGNKRLRARHTMILGDYAEAGELKETGRYFNREFTLPSSFPCYESDNVSKIMFTKSETTVTFQPKFRIIIPSGYYRNINLRDETQATFLEPPKQPEPPITVKKSNIGYRPSKQPVRRFYRGID